MISTEKLIQAIKINGDLELRLYDASRPVTADHWQVGLVARMDIPLAKAHFSAGDISKADFAAFTQSLGGKQLSSKNGLAISSTPQKRKPCFKT